MKKNTIFILFLLSFLIMFSQNGEKNFIDQNYIEITGNAKTEIVPDEIYLNITINETDSKNESVESLEQKMISKFKELQIDIENDFFVLGFNGAFSKYFLKKNDVIKSKNYQLIAHNGLMVSKIFTELDKLNISSFNIEKVSHSQIEKLLKDTKIKALKDAKEKAKQYALAIDQTIGKALHIQELSNYNNPVTYANSISNLNSEYQSLNQSKKTYLHFDKIKLSAKVAAKFELK